MTKKIVITGHTSGIGKAIFDKFTKVSCHDIIGMSRSNGYDIDKDFDKVVEEAAGAEIFINNAYRDSQQLKLFHALKDKVGSIVVMGSVSRHYPELIPTDYVHDKQALAEACRLESINPDGIPVLHLDLGFLEGTEIDDNEPTPTIRQVEFKWQLTPFVKSELERINPNVDFSRVE
jgi:hypothetical protein